MQGGVVIDKEHRPMRAGGQQRTRKLRTGAAGAIDRNPIDRFVGRHAHQVAHGQTAARDVQQRKAGVDEQCADRDVRHHAELDQDGEPRGGQDDAGRHPHDGPWREEADDGAIQAELQENRNGHGDDRDVEPFLVDDGMVDGAELQGDGGPQRGRYADGVGHDSESALDGARQLQQLIEETASDVILPARHDTRLPFGPGRASRSAPAFCHAR